MRASRPTNARVVLRPSGLAGHFGRFVGAGFIPPGALRRRRVRGTMQASSPTEVCDIAEGCGSPVGYGPSVDRRGGFHIRPRAFAPPQGSRADMESAPTGAAIPQPAVFPPFGPGVCAAARAFQNSVFLRRPRLRGRFCFARVCAAGGRHIVGQGARGTVCAGDNVRGGQCARAVPKQDALPRAPQICPPVRPLPGDAAAPRRYNGGRPGTPCVSQRGGYPLYQ